MSAEVIKFEPRNPCDWCRLGLVHAGQPADPRRSGPKACACYYPCGDVFCPAQPYLEDDDDDLGDGAFYDDLALD